MSSQDGRLTVPETQKGCHSAHLPLYRGSVRPLILLLLGRISANQPDAITASNAQVAPIVLFCLLFGANWHAFLSS
jgi:hypothetical protein